MVDNFTDWWKKISICDIKCIHSVVCGQHGAIIVYIFFEIRLTKNRLTYLQREVIYAEV